MSPLEWALLATASAPFAAWLVVSLGCGALAVYVAWCARRDQACPTRHARVLERRHGLVERAAWVPIEGFWQTIAFGCQALQLVRPARPLRLQAAPEATPVLLVAGYLENSGTMWMLGWRLRRRGHLVVHLDLPSTLRRISTNAGWLRARVDEVLAQTGARRVAIVGHSMGGVIGRALVCEDPAAPVACVVSIASPHAGTHLGRLGPGGSARDMTPGSDHVRRFGPERVGGAPVHSVFGLQETIVSPYWSCIVDGGEHVVLDVPAGHTSPLFLGRVADRVDGWLRAAVPAPVGLGSADA